MAYGAIGASAAPDLLRFPPAGTTPYEHSLQLGSGSERFLTAANLLMTWGAQRVAGVEVTDIQTGDTGEYSGIVFDEAGTPELAEAPEDLFTPEGVPYLLPGTTATFTIPRKDPRRVMVISTVNESIRQGFSWGDREQVPGYGEQQITVEQRADGTVWAVVRGFAFTTGGGLLAGRKQKAVLREVTELAESFIAALAPGAAIRTSPESSDPARTELEEPDNEAGETGSTLADENGSQSDSTSEA